MWFLFKSRHDRGLSISARREFQNGTHNNHIAHQACLDHITLALVATALAVPNDPSTVVPEDVNPTQTLAQESTADTTVPNDPSTVVLEDVNPTHSGRIFMTL